LRHRKIGLGRRCKRRVCLIFATGEADELQSADDPYFHGLHQRRVGYFTRDAMLDASAVYGRGVVSMCSAVRKRLNVSRSQRHTVAHVL